MISNGCAAVNVVAASDVVAAADVVMESVPISCPAADWTLGSLSVRHSSTTVSFRSVERS